MVTIELTEQGRSKLRNSTGESPERLTAFKEDVILKPGYVAVTVVDPASGSEKTFFLEAGDIRSVA
jgi:hypothetical protein